MQEAEFRAYAASLEAWARHRPGAYRTRVLLFGALGYVYVFVILALFIAFIGGLVAVLFRFGGAALLAKVLIPAGLFAGTIGRALWVRIEPPPGHLLRGADAPRLFEVIDEVCRSVGAPRAHRVLLTDELNASISQVPRLGLFGWPRNYLHVGLPLLCALPEDEARAVLAHEFGHLSGAHGRSATWAYRVRAIWMRIRDELSASESHGRFLFEPFFRWYAPRFEAFSFVLARAQEFEADRDAAAAASPRAAAAALARMAIGSAYEGRVFWKAIWNRSRTEAQPPSGAFLELAEGLAAAGEQPGARVWLRQALDEPTRAWDTHPSLSARLASIASGLEPDRLVPAARIPRSAAEAWLGEESCARWLERMSADWARAVEEHWSAGHAEAVQAREKLRAISERADQGELSAEDLAELAWGTVAAVGDDAALPYFRELVARAPENGEARLALGRLLLGRDQEEGLGHLQQAARGVSDLVPVACQEAIGFLEARGRDDEAAPFRARAREHEELMEAVSRERSPGQLSRRDAFLAHGLDENTVFEVMRPLWKYDSIRRAYLVRKVVRLLPERPLFILALEYRPGFLGGSPDENRLLNEILAGLPPVGDLIAVTLRGAFAPLTNPLKAVSGSEIYVQGRHYRAPAESPTRMDEVAVAT